MQALIKLEENGSSAVVNYNVPQPTIYRGRVTRQLPIDPSFFKKVSNPFTGPGVKSNPSLDEVRKAMLNGFNDPALFPQLGVPPNYLAYVDEKDDTPLKYRPWQGAGDLRKLNLGAFFKGLIAVGLHGWNSEANAYAGPQVGFGGTGDEYITDELAMLTPEVVRAKLLAGLRLFITKNNAGQYSCTWDPVDPNARPGIAIIERYQLSTFLGNYGAGRTLQTFSLLPGEKSKVSIKSYLRTTTTTKSSSSILDSYDAQSAQEFSDNVADEQTRKQDKKDSLKWHVEAEAESDFGFVSAQLSASYRGGSNAGREQFAKGMHHAISRHATKASSKRDIKVQQSQETTTSTGEENGIEREIQNVNVGRTLNFVFRQMNQEFITLLHLVDVELAYSTGFPGGARRYALSEMDKMLAEWVEGTAGFRETISSQILDELQNIIDYQGNPQNFIERVSLDAVIPPADRIGAPPATYFRARRDLSSSYTSLGKKLITDIPGIILSATETVLRTDGLIVEALLGQGEGMDDYSKNLQTEAVSAVQNANDLKLALVRRKQLVASIAASGDTGKGKLYAQLYANEPYPVLPGGVSEPASKSRTP